ncbi:hypothetical protein [Salinibacterium sp. M195]|uniref:hypothetical protein n=1 Tax=Salinibacterium sp. M195 TaxID=2583374 RepID=UPI001C636019|nr:hypothetical protein [Salinibacterium sp. M195]QYH34898.1 hypothetical protein FFT87_02440 [Salinibacterium sp. M195]
MTSAHAEPLPASTAWYVPLARAIPALALAAVITFSADHSARLGLVTLASFTLVAGAVIMTASVLSPHRGVARNLTITQGGVTLATAIAAFVATSGGQAYFVFLLTAFAAITGFIELYLGLRSRGRDALSRDWVFAGALTALLALVVLLVPPGFSQQFTGPDGIDRELTASVVVVGLLGAYWAILGVYLVIAALSLKWSRTDRDAVTVAVQEKEE